MPSKFCSDSNSAFANLDRFGRSFKWNLPGKRETLGTPFGASITISMFCVLVFYGIMQMHRLIQFGETIVMSSVKDSYYTMHQAFPEDIEELQYNKFQIAFALTAYDGNPDPIDDPQYGRLYARYVQWGFEEERN